MKSRLSLLFFALSISFAHASAFDDSPPPPVPSGVAGQFYNGSGGWSVPSGAGSTGNIVGSGSTTSGHAVCWNNTSATAAIDCALIPLGTAGNGSSLTGLVWSQLGSTPTTLAGYGITNGVATGANSSLTSLTGLTTPLTVAQGGSGAATLTTAGLVLAHGTSPFTALAEVDNDCVVGAAGAWTAATCPGGSGLTVNSSTITGGGSGHVLYDDGTKLQEIAYGLTGNSTIVETTTGGLLTASILPIATTGAFGAVKPDGTTVTISAGLISAVGGAATTITPGTTTIVGATAPCSITNSATTVMGCLAYGLTGNSTLVETTSGGLLTASILPLATTSTAGGVIIGSGLVVTAGTVSTAITQASHAGSFSTWNIGGEDDMSSTGTATLPTFTAGQSALLTAQSGVTATVGLNSQTVNGLGLNTTLHQFGFYGYAYDSAGVASAFGFPGFGTITTNAISKFLDGTGAQTASGLTDNGTTVSTAENVTLSGSTVILSGVSAGTIASGKNLGLDSSNHIVTATVSGGSGCATSGTANLVLLDDGAGGCKDIAGIGTSGQVLTSNGAGVAPTMQAAGGGGITCPTGFTATGATCAWTQNGNNTVASMAWTGLVGNEYRLSCSGMKTASTDTINMQFGESTGPTWETANYNRNLMYALSSAGSAGTHVIGATGMFAVATASSGADLWSGDFLMSGLTSTTANKTATGTMNAMSGSDLLLATEGDRYTGDQNAITAIRLITGGANFVTPSTCTLYAL